VTISCEWKVRVHIETVNTVTARTVLSSVTYRPSIYMNNQWLRDTGTGWTSKSCLISGETSELKSIFFDRFRRTYFCCKYNLKSWTFAGKYSSTSCELENCTAPATLVPSGRSCFYQSLMIFVIFSVAKYSKHSSSMYSMSSIGMWNISSDEKTTSKIQIPAVKAMAIERFECVCILHSEQRGNNVWFG